MASLPYVRDACVERALTCRSRSMLPRMLTRTCFALPGRLQEHPNDYSDQLLHPVARLGAQGAALKAVFKERDRVRWTPPTRPPTHISYTKWKSYYDLKKIQYLYEFTTLR